MFQQTLAIGTTKDRKKFSVLYFFVHPNQKLFPHNIDKSLSEATMSKPVYNTCRICGSIFSSAIPLAYCNEHKYIDDKQFSIVEEYVIKHPLCNAIEVHNNTKISLLELLRYIDEGRLSIVEEKMYVKKNQSITHH
jgi:hypothetical protein